ncbi:MAG: peptidylprolyl isomerase [Candidatus Adiutrix sp.]
MLKIKMLKCSLAIILAALLFAGCDRGAEVSPETEPTLDTGGLNLSLADDSEMLFVDDGALAARVNGVPIKQSVLNAQVAMASAGRNVFSDDSEEASGPDSHADLLNQEAKARDFALRSDVLSNLISLELACQEAIGQGYAPQDEEVLAALEDLKSDYDDPSQLYKDLARYGESEEQLKEQLAKTLALRNWQRFAFIEDIKVSDAEAKSFYDARIDDMAHEGMMRISQILFGVPLAAQPNTKSEALKTAEAVLAKLQGGADFAQMAAEYSNEPDAKATGGDMGWLPLNRPQLFIDETVFNLKAGEISAVLESPVGFHIFKVTDQRPAGVEPFENVRLEIIDFLAGEKLGAAVRNRMVELRENAEIEIFDPQLAQALNPVQ